MTPIVTAQTDLFGVADALPQGLSFEADFIGTQEECALLDIAAALPLQSARYQQYTARRRVHAWGAGFDFGQGRLRHAAIGELPPPLHRLREQLAAWVGVAADDFVHVMVSEYQRGTPLGWHRDAPAYELITGVSLGNMATLRFRPYPPQAAQRENTIALQLAPRSAYAMRGVARWGWQHSVPPVPGLRYSVTMRTAR